MFVLMLCTVVGCRRSGRTIEVYAVKGKITMDGQLPPPMIHVRLVPKDVSAGGEEAGGYSNAEGEFKVASLNADPDAGAMLGDYVVVLSKKVKDPKAPPGALPKETLPLIYTMPDTTPFSVTVQKGRNANNFEFDMDSKAPAPPKKTR